MNGPFAVMSSDGAVHTYPTGYKLKHDKFWVFVHDEFGSLQAQFFQPRWAVAR